MALHEIQVGYSVPRYVATQPVGGAWRTLSVEAVSTEVPAASLAHVVVVALPQDVYHKLAQYAAEEQLSTGELAREAIELFVEGEERERAAEAAWLCDGETQRHIDAAAEAHRRADAGEDVDWDTVIDEHILG